MCMDLLEFQLFCDVCRSLQCLFVFQEKIATINYLLAIVLEPILHPANDVGVRGIPT
jgi:hypothetical protein